MNKLLATIVPFANTILGALVVLFFVVWTLSHQNIIFGLLLGVLYVAILCVDEKKF